MKLDEIKKKIEEMKRTGDYTDIRYLLNLRAKAKLEEWLVRHGLG